MIIKEYMIPVYGLLVAGGSWNLNLEHIEGDSKKVVPEEYRTLVAEYLAEKQAVI